MGGFNPQQMQQLFQGFGQQGMGQQGYYGRPQPFQGGFGGQQQGFSQPAFGQLMGGNGMGTPGWGQPKPLGQGVPIPSQPRGWMGGNGMGTPGWGQQTPGGYQPQPSPQITGQPVVGGVGTGGYPGFNQGRMPDLREQQNPTGQALPSMNRTALMPGSYRR